MAVEQVSPLIVTLSWPASHKRKTWPAMLFIPKTSPNHQKGGTILTPKIKIDSMPPKL